MFLDTFQIDIPGRPVPMKEIEFNFKTKRAYRSDKYKKHKERVNYLCQEYLDDYDLPKPLFLADTPVELSLELVYEFTTDMFFGGNKNNFLKEPISHWYMKKVDMDNVLKPLQDGMIGAVFEDDSQLCKYGSIVKVYGYDPTTLITVKALPEY